MDDLRPRVRGLTSLFAVALISSACSTPDPDGTYDDFLDRIADAAVRPDAPQLAQIPDISGRFIVAMAGSPQPDTPFYFIGVNTFTDNGDGTGKLTSQLTPLTVADKQLVGDTFVFPEVMVSMTGEYTAEIPKGIVPAPADPILGAELTIEPFTAMGVIKSEDVYCGDVTGWLTSPLTRDLSGSTFGAMRVSDTAIGDELPIPPARCTDGDPDAGVPDASVSDATPAADAEVPDAEVPDAEVPDAEVPDAQLPDAGV